MSNTEIRMSSDRNIKLICIFILALLMFNYPLIQLFGTGKFIFGIPLIYASLFTAWLVLIGVIFRMMRSFFKK